MESLLKNPGIFSMIAEVDGRIVGSNFLDERSVISSVGPITVDPSSQNVGVGRKLMVAVMERARKMNAPGIRLVQAAYHNRSLSLYAMLGFDIKEPLAIIQGRPLQSRTLGYEVREAETRDLEACNQICFNVHGHSRPGELSEAVNQGSAMLVERNGRITGYTTGVAFFGHSVAESNGDLESLIASAKEFGGLGFLLPLRNTELLRWCMGKELRVVQLMTLMAIGLYKDPSGACLSSIGY
jgi:GNAT superfamily N-acetyltransferase